MKSSSAEGVTLRRARLGDADAVAAIEGARPSAGGWTPRQLREEVSHPDSIFVVAEKAHVVVGHFLGRVEAGVLRIYTVAVSPEHERQGVASACLAFALERAREAKCARVSLEVSASNGPAKALYEAAGFHVVGRRPKFYNDGSDALLMDLAL